MKRRRFLKEVPFGVAGLATAPVPSLIGRLQAAGVSIPKIKITGVTLHRIREETAQDMGWCPPRVGEFFPGATIVEVKTDAGITGWGDGDAGEQILQRDPKRVIGRSPFEVEALFDEVRSTGSTVIAPAGPPRPQGAPIQAGGTAGGLDIAIWDLLGRALNKPCCQLIGKQYRKRVMPYASAGYSKKLPRPAEGFAEELLHCTRVVGFHAAKMRVGYDPTTDAAIIAAVRKAIGPHIHLGIDSGSTGAYDVGSAIALGEKLEEHNLEFWQEPIDKYDLAGYARLRRALKVPLASGEDLPMNWVMKHYVQEEAVDIVQPDIGRIGLTGGKRMTYLCWLFNVRLVPHSWGGPIRVAAEMHWVASVPPVSNALNPPPALFGLHLPNESPAWTLTKKRIEVDKRDGCIEIPDAPGLGIEIDFNVLERFRVDRVNIA